MSDMNILILDDFTQPLRELTEEIENIKKNTVNNEKENKKCEGENNDMYIQ